ncbi:hypothetical protein [Bosea vestrisii]|uniref:Uncharacterized protein n=1 Tax=Bosea vestrisii TaxID=151416 RepID=A0ABW0H315_9HYPH
MSVEMVRFRVTDSDDGGEYSKLSGRGAGGEQLELYRPQQDGISTRPKKGALGIALFDRSRENGVVISVESAGERPKGQEEGGKTVYGPNGQAYVMKPDGSVMLKAEAGDQIITPKEAGGKVYLGGDPAKGHQFARVMTESGASPFVWARYA